MDTEEKIKQIIDHIRPYILADGGDLNFVSYQENIVTVSLSGACIGCSMIDYTLNEGVKSWIMDEIPEVKDVIMQPVFSDNTTEEEISELKRIIDENNARYYAQLEAETKLDWQEED